MTEPPPESGADLPSTAMSSADKPVDEAAVAPVIPEPEPSAPPPPARRAAIPWRLIAGTAVLVAVLAASSPWWLPLVGAPKTLIAMVRRTTQDLPGWARPVQTPDPAPPVPGQTALGADTESSPGLPPSTGSAAVAAKVVVPEVLPPPPSQPPPSPPPPAAAAPADHSAEIDALHQQVDAIDKRVDAQSAAALAARVAGIEARLDRLTLSIRSNAALVLASGEIEQAIATGTAYDAPLAVIRAETGDDADLTAALDTLAVSAKSGLSTRWSLADALDHLPEPAAASRASGANAGYWDRLWTRLSSVVTVTHSGGAPAVGSATPNPENRVAWAVAALHAGDLGAAIEEISALDGEAAERAKPWLERAKALRDAEAASAALRSRLTARLVGDEKRG